MRASSCTAGQQKQIKIRWRLYVPWDELLTPIIASSWKFRFYFSFRSWGYGFFWKDIPPRTHAGYSYAIFNHLIFGRLEFETLNSHENWLCYSGAQRSASRSYRSSRAALTRSSENITMHVGIRTGAFLHLWIPLVPSLPLGLLASQHRCLHFQ